MKRAPSKAGARRGDAGPMRRWWLPFVTADTLAPPSRRSAPTPSDHQARRDEWLSALTHAGAAVVALVGTPALLAAAPQPAAYLAAAVFAVALAAMFSISGLLHATPPGRRQRLLEVLDRCAIYALIAATYAPFAALVLPAPWGPALLVALAAGALVGVAANLNGLRRHRPVAALEGLNLILFIALGWAGPVLLGKVFLTAIPAGGLAWLLVGGLFYTGGVFFYRWQRLPYHHTIWHLFVIAGAASHYVAIRGYALPAG